MTENVHNYVSNQYNIISSYDCMHIYTKLSIPLNTIYVVKEIGDKSISYIFIIDNTRFNKR
jgi:5-methylthioribose kinase